MGEEYMRMLAAGDAVVYAPTTGVALFAHPEHAIEAVVNDSEWRQLYLHGERAVDEGKRLAKEIDLTLDVFAHEERAWALADLGDLLTRREIYDLLWRRIWQLRVARGYEIGRSLPVDYTYPGMPT